MKKRIIAITLILIIIMSNVCLGAYSREGTGTKLNTIAKNITDSNTNPIDAKYNASSINVALSDIKVLDYGNQNSVKDYTLSQKQTPSDATYNKTDDNWYLEKTTIGDASDYLFYTIKLKGTDTVSIDKFVSFLYEDGITYNGKTYDIRIDVENVTKTGTDDNTFKMAIGKREKSDDNAFDFSTYNEPFNPSLGVGVGNSTNPTNNHIEVEVKYYAIDDNGTETEISGVLGVTDIDLNQGFAIGGYLAANDNIYMENMNIDTIEVKTDSIKNDTFIYSTTDANIPDHQQAGSNIYAANAYALIDSKKPLDLTFTFDNLQAYSSILFMNDILTRKYRVVFDPDGGTPTPTVQEVAPGGKATEPTGNAKPQKEGNTLTGWRRKNGTTVDPTNFNFENTTIDEDIELKAMWTPESYNIYYELYGGLNNSSNPNTYTYGDTITLQPPTRTGYDFMGWFTEASYTNQKDGISSSDTGDKTFHAKWQEQTPQSSHTYKVEHYKETTNGQYELATTDELSGQDGATVTATPKVFPGYKENTTHESRVPTGTVASDNSLVLKLYYDKEKYNVTFDTEGGKPTPEKQVVNYNDKATKPNNPSKSGYEFQYWYYLNDNDKEVQYSFDDPVTKDIELFAKWKEVKETDDGDDGDGGTEKEEKGNTVIPSKINDTTVAQKIIPYTGRFGYIVIISIIVLAGVFGGRYYYLKKIMK